MDSSEFKYLAFLAIIPVIVLLSYIFIRDKYHKEPLGLLAKAFIYGAIAAFPIVWVEGIFDCFISLLPGPFIQPVAKGVIGAAVPEECFKFLFLYQLIWHNKEFDEHIDGIVYATFVSLGFACLENFLFIFGAYGEEGFAAAASVGYSRAMFSIPCHFLCGVLMGYFFSLAKFERVDVRKYFGYALLTPIIFHGAYDALLFVMNQDVMANWAGLLFLLFIVLNIYIWRRGVIRIRHLASLLVPEGPEASAFKSCAQCGKVYESNRKCCPVCKSNMVQVEEPEVESWTPSRPLTDEEREKLHAFLQNLINGRIEERKDDSFSDRVSGDRENDDCAPLG